MITTFVIDDEWYNMEEIAGMVDETGFLEVVGKYQNPIEALSEFDALSPQVVFIDIEMPEINGLTLAERLLEKKPDTIIAFITSWNQYAVQAFDLNAIDYIQKPIRKERFLRMSEKIRKEVEINKIVNVTLKPNFIINCFGRLETYINGQPILWERAKAEELFAYLLTYHDTYVHKEKIIETLWTEYEPVKALHILQTSICRIRKVFAPIKDQVILHYSGSKYCLSIKNAQCDLFEVEMLKTLDFNEKDYLDQLENGVSIFLKGYLSEQGFLWSMEKEEEWNLSLKQIIKKSMLRAKADSCASKHLRYQKMLAILSPYDDELNYQYLLALKMSGNGTEALNHYKNLRDLLNNTYDMEPSERINNLFLGQSL